MKHVLKGLAFVLLMALAIQATNYMIDIFASTTILVQAGEIKWKAVAYALFGVVASIGLSLKCFEWFCTHLYNYQKAEDLKKSVKADPARTQIEDKLIEYATANERLKKANESLHAELEAVFKRQAQIKPGPHTFDDWALDRFVIQMRGKLERKRFEGWANWNLCDLDALRRRLAEQTRKNEGFDPVDVANYAMMLWLHDAFPEECANPESVIKQPV